MKQRSYLKSAYASITCIARVLFSKRVGISSLRAVAIMSICALLGAGITLSSAPSKAFAAPATPPTDWSFYITSASTSTAFNLGCSQGHFDSGHSPVIDSEVILDFGEQYYSDGSGGVLLLSGIQISNAQIQAVTEAFSDGYWDCTGTDSTSVLYLGIGINNYGNSTYASGVTWGNNVAAIQNSNKSKGYTAQVAMYGANDIESWCPSNCVSPSAVMSWVNGFSSVPGSYKYFNLGSADGCPAYSSGNGACNGAWNQYDYWYLSYGAPAALSVPEIYYAIQANQWAMISLYGSQYQAARIYFAGPLDEYDLDNTTLTAPQAWSNLWNDINSNTATTDNMPFSFEIHNE